MGRKNDAISLRHSRLRRKLCHTKGTLVIAREFSLAVLGCHEVRDSWPSPSHTQVSAVRAIAIPLFFLGNQARAESRTLSLPFLFGGQRRYQAMRPGVGKVPDALLELESSTGV
jgi:hypothetical protein